MYRLITITLATTLCASVAMAHEGPRIWIGNVEGRITTFGSDNDIAPTVYWPSRLFQTELQQFSTIFTTEFPGFEVKQFGGNVAVGTTFAFDITGPALYFDETNETFVTTTEAFGPPEPGPIPQFAVSLGATVRTTSSGPVAGFDFFTFNGIGDHSHLSYTLLGNGSTASDGPDGVYALSFTLSSTALDTSDIFYLLLGKNVLMTDPLFESAYAVALEELIGAGSLGDMNCDEDVNGIDIDLFLDAVLNPGNFSGCDIHLADTNMDGFVDENDIASFVLALLNG